MLLGPFLMVVTPSGCVGGIVGGLYAMIHVPREYVVMEEP